MSLLIENQVFQVGGVIFIVGITVVAVDLLIRWFEEKNKWG